MTDSVVGASSQRIRITLVKSTIGYREQQRRVVRSLGLKRLRQTVEHVDSPSIRGMVNKVHHLVTVEPVTDNSPFPSRETGSQRFAARLEARAAEYDAILNELLADAKDYEARQAGHGASADLPSRSAETRAVTPTGDTSEDGTRMGVVHDFDDAV